MRALRGAVHGLEEAQAERVEPQRPVHGVAGPPVRREEVDLLRVELADELVRLQRREHELERLQAVLRLDLDGRAPLALRDPGALDEDGGPEALVEVVAVAAARRGVRALPLVAGHRKVGVEAHALHGAPGEGAVEALERRRLDEPLEQGDVLGHLGRLRPHVDGLPDRGHELAVRQPPAAELAAVEDPVARRGLAHVLRAEPHDVVEAHDHREVVRALQIPVALDERPERAAERREARVLLDGDALLELRVRVEREVPHALHGQVRRRHLGDGAGPHDVLGLAALGLGELAEGEAPRVEVPELDGPLRPVVEARVRGAARAARRPRRRRRLGRLGLEVQPPEARLGLLELLEAVALPDAAEGLEERVAAAGRPRLGRGRRRDVVVVVELDFEPGGVVGVVGVLAGAGVPRGRVGLLEASDGGRRAHGRRGQVPWRGSRAAAGQPRRSLVRDARPCGVARELGSRPCGVELRLDEARLLAERSRLRWFALLTIPMPGIADSRCVATIDST